MTLSTSAAAICLVACHGGPADHFATFAENLSKDVAIEIYATGPALKKFQERGIEVKFPFSIDKISAEEEDALAEQIAKACATASVVITDVGHSFDIKVQNALARLATQVSRFAYYDNPEAYVPGGYSAVAADVMQAAQGVLFANSNLAQTAVFQTPGSAVDLGSRTRVGIGYYPVSQAEKIASKRAEEQSAKRQAFFQKNGLEDKGQKVLIYFGGNNKEYFSRALPAFLSLLEEGMVRADFTNLVIVLQQHPGAKTENIDREVVERWIKTHSGRPQTPKMVISDFNSDDAQILADGALYYQTSMGPQFMLAGIPTMQIGHETYEDILVKNRLCPSITRVGQLLGVVAGLSSKQKTIPRDVIRLGLGIRQDWLNILKRAIMSDAEIASKRTVAHSGFQAKKSHLPYHMAMGSLLLAGLVVVQLLKRSRA